MSVRSNNILTIISHQNLIAAILLWDIHGNYIKVLFWDKTYSPKLILIKKALLSHVHLATVTSKADTNYMCSLRCVKCGLANVVFANVLGIRKISKWSQNQNEFCVSIVKCVFSINFLTYNKKFRIAINRLHHAHKYISFTSISLWIRWHFFYSRNY